MTFHFSMAFHPTAASFFVTARATSQTIKICEEKKNENEMELTGKFHPFRSLQHFRLNYFV